MKQVKQSKRAAKSSKAPTRQQAAQGAPNAKAAPKAKAPVKGTLKAKQAPKAARAAKVTKSKNPRQLALALEISPTSRAAVAGLGLAVDPSITRAEKRALVLAAIKACGPRAKLGDMTRHIAKTTWLWGESIGRYARRMADEGLVELTREGEGKGHAMLYSLAKKQKAAKRATKKVAKWNKRAAKKKA